MQIKEEISRRKYFELNENTTYQNLWNAVHVLGKARKAPLEMKPPSSLVEQSKKNLSLFLNHCHLSIQHIELALSMYWALY